MEEIASGDEGNEDDYHEYEDGSYVAPNDGATSQTRPDPAPTSDLPETMSAAADADQAKTRQPEAPPAGASATADLSEQPAAPSA